MRQLLRLFVLANIVAASACLSVISAQGTQPASASTEADILTHKRFYFGLGGGYTYMTSIPTGNVVTVASTFQGVTTYDQQELKTSNNFWGFHITLPEFYFSEDAFTNLSFYVGWSGTPQSDIEGLEQSESTFLTLSSLMVNYNFLVDGGYRKNSSRVCYYVGAGPTLIWVHNMEASATLSDGTKREVSAKYSPAVGIAFEIGANFMFQEGRYVKIACRLGVPFDKMAVDELTVKENGAPIAANKKNMNTVGPTYFSIFFSYDF